MMLLRKIFSSGRTIKILAVAICLLLIFSVVFFVVSRYDDNHSEFQGDGDGNVGSEKTIEYNGQTFVFNEHIETVLVVGLDAFGKAEITDSYNNDRQADFIVLLLLDRKKNTCQAIHINRDTMTNVPKLGVTGQQTGIINQQISLSHTYGNGEIDSCHNVAVTVSRMLFDIPIDNYVSLTMDGIKLLNDLVGGVTVTVLDDFTGVDDTLIKGEQTTLIGDHALNYVRARNELADSSNERRMVRQRQYMEALYKQGKAAAEADENFVFDAVTAMNDYIVSNCSVSQIDELFEQMTTYEFVGIETIAGDVVKGEKYMEFHFDPDELKKLVVECFYLPQNKD